MHTNILTASYPDYPEKPSLAVVEVMDFMKMNLPYRETILSPWLPAQGLAMIYAPRGIGKTHVALGIAYAVTSNTDFLGWKPTKARNVLYLDGEMPAALMQERLLALAHSNKAPLLASFKLITPDLQSGAMPDLATPKGQVMLETHLAGAELIIVDNISTLCRNTRENEADSWLPVQEWALRMRAAGKSVLFIHHAGKGGNQRGTSKREDILDTVISLKRPDDYKPKDGAVFQVHFEKARGFLGKDTEPFEAKFGTRSDGLQEWIMSPTQDTSYDQAIRLANKGLDQTQIAETLSINKSNVSRHLKRAHQEGKIS
jgi:putative DNA primase/helicase